MEEDKINEILKKYPSNKSENLIFILQEVQNLDGYLSIEAVKKISKFLSIPIIKIYSVATFYDDFKFKPAGKYVVQVCKGTSCHINKSNDLINEIKVQLSLINGSKDEEAIFSIQEVACLGACDKGPVFAIENQYYTNANPDIVKPALEKFLENKNL